MQIFITGTPFETARDLDPRRLNKQIIETEQIINAILGIGKGWFNHPVVKMYKNDVNFLMSYLCCLDAYRKGDLIKALQFSDGAMNNKPVFIDEYLITQMKRRLYTKDNNYYSQWKDLGESSINFYYVDGNWLYYENGKLIKN